MKLKVSVNLEINFTEKDINPEKLKQEISNDFIESKKLIKEGFLEDWDYVEILSYEVIE